MGKMTIGQMVAQLASGMLISTQIFVITLLFSLPLGLIAVSYTHLDVYKRQDMGNTGF